MALNEDSQHWYDDMQHLRCLAAALKDMSQVYQTEYEKIRVAKKSNLTSPVALKAGGNLNRNAGMVHKSLHLHGQDSLGAGMVDALAIISQRLHETERASSFDG